MSGCTHPPHTLFGLAIITREIAGASRCTLTSSSKSERSWGAYDTRRAPARHWSCAPTLRPLCPAASGAAPARRCGGAGRRPVANLAPQTRRAYAGRSAPARRALSNCGARDPAEARVTAQYACGGRGLNGLNGVRRAARGASYERTSGLGLIVVRFAFGAQAPGRFRVRVCVGGCALQAAASSDERVLLVRRSALARGASHYTLSDSITDCVCSDVVVEDS